LAGNPLLKQIARRRSGDKAEKRAAKRLGGAAIPGSGALDGYKGDIDRADFRIENKSSRGARSIGVKHEWLRKISAEARSVGKTPALALQFTDDEGRPRDSASAWVAIPEWMFKEAFSGSEVFEECGG
jgi:hypothetical protein